MHLKFYRDRKKAARASLGWKWNDTECELTDDEWFDWLAANGKVVPCKNERRWNNFVSWFWTLVILAAVLSASFYALSFFSPVEGFLIVMLLWLWVWTLNRKNH